MRSRPASSERYLCSPDYLSREEVKEDVLRSPWLPCGSPQTSSSSSLASLGQASDLGPCSPHERQTTEQSRDGLGLERRWLQLGPARLAE